MRPRDVVVDLVADLLGALGLETVFTSAGTGGVVDVTASERVRRRLLDRVPAELRAGRPRRGERAHVVVAALLEQPERYRPNGARCADDTDPLLRH